MTIVVIYNLRNCPKGYHHNRVHVGGINECKWIYVCLVLLLSPSPGHKLPCGRWNGADNCVKQWHVFGATLESSLTWIAGQHLHLWSCRANTVLSICLTRDKWECKSFAPDSVWLSSVWPDKCNTGDLQSASSCVAGAGNYGLQDRQTLNTTTTSAVVLLLIRRW